MKRIINNKLNAWTSTVAANDVIFSSILDALLTLLYSVFLISRNLSTAKITMHLIGKSIFFCIGYIYYLWTNVLGPTNECVLLLWIADILTRRWVSKKQLLKLAELNFWLRKPSTSFRLNTMNRLNSQVHCAVCIAFSWVQDLLSIFHTKKYHMSRVKKK